MDIEDWQRQYRDRREAAINSVSVQLNDAQLIAAEHFDNPSPETIAQIAAVLAIEEHASRLDELLSAIEMNTALMRDT